MRSWGLPIPWRLLYSFMAFIRTWLKPLGPASRFAIRLNSSRIGTSSGLTEKLVMIVDLFNNLFNNSPFCIIFSLLLPSSSLIIVNSRFSPVKLAFLRKVGRKPFRKHQVSRAPVSVAQALRAVFVDGFLEKGAAPAPRLLDWNLNDGFSPSRKPSPQLRLEASKVYARILDKCPQSCGL